MGDWGGGRAVPCLDRSPAAAHGARAARPGSRHLPSPRRRSGPATAAPRAGGAGQRASQSPPEPGGAEPLPAGAAAVGSDPLARGPGSPRFADRSEHRSSDGQAAWADCGINPAKLPKPVSWKSARTFRWRRRAIPQRVLAVFSTLWFSPD